jgi:P-type conjugative transfer protein TrbG
MRFAVLYRSLFALSLVLGSCIIGAPDAHAASSPRQVLPDGTIRYDYGRRPTPLLVCTPRYVCDIALDGGESVLNMAIGDSARWVIAGGQSGPSGTVPHVFVKPMKPGLDTNLVITTTKRVYDVLLRSTETTKDARISFFYADEDAAAKAVIADRQRSAIESVIAGTPQVGPDQADTKYKVSGETTLLPDKVFNDGLRTFVVWKALPSELPTVATIGKDGSAQATNFRVVGSSYIIDGVNPNYDLVIAASADRRGRPERRVSIRHI